MKIVESYVNKRLINGVRFTEKRGFNIAMYSWEMELTLDNTEFPLGEEADLIFRKANKEDGLDYKNIISNAFGDNLGEDALMETLRDPSIEIYVLENQGQTIGSASVQVRRNLSLAYIYDIAILSDYRGQGLGSYLLQSCITDLKEKDIHKDSLLVTGENKRALKFYRKIGFKEVDIDLIMAKRVE